MKLLPRKLNCYFVLFLYTCGYCYLGLCESSHIFDWLGTLLLVLVVDNINFDDHMVPLALHSS